MTACPEMRMRNRPRTGIAPPMAPRMASGFSRRFAHWLGISFGICLALTSAPAPAGTGCHQRAPEPEELRAAVQLGHAVRETLDSLDAEVAVVARVGQDLSPWGLRYSHAGFAWRDHPAGRWQVVHLLNECGTDRSALYVEGMANFFTDVVRHEASIVVPPAAVGRRLAGLLSSGDANRLHEPRYSMLAYVFSTRYQNSNQWLLEVYAAAAQGDGDLDRNTAQRWLKTRGFAPITVEVPAWKRLGGRLFRANIAFDDHPFGRRMAGQIDTTTVDSIVRFLERRGEVSSSAEVFLPGAEAGPRMDSATNK